MQSKTTYPERLYHYSSMEKAYAILSNKNIRLSDITKSNDVNEMSIFFPGLFDEMLKLYNQLGFDCDFQYKGKSDKEAFYLLLSELKEQIYKEFRDGSIATFVLCLSEKEDLLSQWRGYANDGKGVSLAINTSELLQLIKNNNRYYEFVKVKYLSKDELKYWIIETAKELLNVISIILVAIKDGDIIYKSQYELEDDIYRVMYYNILEYIEYSIRFKLDGFSEECEWRFYINNSINKEISKTSSYIIKAEKGVKWHSNLIKYIHEKMEFNVTNNDIIPFINIRFDELNNNAINEVKCGPNNKIRTKDLEAFLIKNEYNNCTVTKSNITYISR